MCGIAGIISSNPVDISLSRLKEMSDTIAHRGPDGDGQWIDDEGNVGLTHRRLSIIDLSCAGSQPMHYMDRYTIVFNGEVYNYIELKERLLKEGYTFQSTTDTEVLMALYHHYREECLGLIDGMFAFAIYDAIEKKVFCARDRFGEKPFFYHYQPGKVFLFASEMKALWKAGVSKEVSNQMLFNYLQHGYLDNPQDVSDTFYAQCKRLPHGHYLLIDTRTLQISIKQYYDINTSEVNPDITEQEATAKFRELLFTSVQRRLRSDVPVGSSLSGGLDSSLIVCLINQLLQGSNGVQKSFSAVFPGFEKDERKYIDAVVGATNTEAHFITPQADDLINNVDKLLYHQEEPVGSASIFVQFCVMGLAKANGVTVLLDGQGADEILGGYTFFYKRYFQELARTNKTLFTKELSAYEAMMAGNYLNAHVYRGWKNKLGIHFEKFAPAGKRLLTAWNELRHPFFNKDFYASYRKETFQDMDRENTLNKSLYSATMRKGLQELLRYADRNSMAHSREVRVPFLYHELVDFLFTLPAHFKIRDGWTKWLLRESFKDILPSQIGWRKDKIGYEPPQKSWLSGDQAKQVMMEKRDQLIKTGILHSSYASKPLQAHEANTVKNESWKIWMAASVLG